MTNPSINQPITLNIVYYLESWMGETTEQLHEAIALFQERHPSVKLNVVTPELDDFNRMIRNGALSDFDLIRVRDCEFHACVRAGLLADLNPYLAANNVHIGDYFTPELLNLTTKNDQLFSIPYLVGMLFLYYNKKWFDEAGLPYPDGTWTTEEFLDIAGKLKEIHCATGEDKQVISLPLDTGILEQLVRSNGGSYLSPDGLKAAGYWDSPETIEALVWVADLIRRYRLAANTDNWYNIDNFTKEQVGMVGAWGPDDSDFIGVTSLPRFPGKTKKVPMTFRSLGIASTTRHPELSWELLFELAFKDNAMLQGYFPALQSASERLLKDQQGNSGVWPGFEAKVLYENIRYAVPFTDWDYLDEAYPVVAKIGEPDSDVGEMMRQLAIKLDKALTNKNPLAVN